MSIVRDSAEFTASKTLHFLRKYLDTRSLTHTQINHRILVTFGMLNRILNVHSIRKGVIFKMASKMAAECLQWL